MNEKQDIAPAILKHLRADKRAMSRHLEQYSKRESQLLRSRHVDQTLQRLRRKGLITYDRRLGWGLTKEGERT